MIDTIVLLVVAETALNGIAAGASLDQSIKQLPAQHRIGVFAYSAYSQASAMGNGIFWYAGVGHWSATSTEDDESAPEDGIPTADRR